jgi:hypothetical protein
MSSSSWKHSHEKSNINLATISGPRLKSLRSAFGRRGVE